MLSAAERRRLTVVLVGARNPGNIGAAARAMQDFGFGDLRVVNAFGAPFEAAQAEAKAGVGAAGVLAAARRFGSVAEAVADCTLVAGTTAVGEREIAQRLVTLQAGAGEMLAALGGEGQRVALLFGSEKTGLTREQLSHCGLLVTIPLFAPEGGRHLSMNLGQSVAVCLYELTRGGLEGAREVPEVHEAAATAEDRERLTQLLLEAMEASGYARRFPANARETVVRGLVLQLGRSHAEAMTWMGILKQWVRQGVGNRE